MECSLQLSLVTHNVKLRGAALLRRPTRMQGWALLFLLDAGGVAALFGVVDFLQGLYKQVVCRDLLGNICERLVKNF